MIIIQIKPEKEDKFIREIDKNEATLGAAPDNDIVLSYPRISRKHIQIERIGDVITVKDLGSTNGLFVNDERVSSADITTDDKITIGNVVLQISLERRKKADGTVGQAVEKKTEEEDILGGLYEGLSKYTRAPLNKYQLKDEDLSRLSMQQLQERFKKLQEEYKKIDYVNELTKLLNIDIDLDELLEIILTSALKFLNFERGCIMLQSLETGELYLRKSNRAVLESGDPEKFQFSMSVTKYTFKTEKSIMIPDALEFTEFKSSQSIISTLS
jgi:pSer/pThr/pTyr-binding forkhead associated (FHA) protein